jgi:hypothetical protein
MNNPEAEPRGINNRKKICKNWFLFIITHPYTPPEGIFRNFRIPSFISFSDPRVGELNHLLLNQFFFVPLNDVKNVFLRIRTPFGTWIPIKE